MTLGPDEFFFDLTRDDLPAFLADLAARGLYVMPSPREARIDGRMGHVYTAVER